MNRMLPRLVNNAISPQSTVDMKKQQLRDSVAKYRVRQAEEKARMEGERQQGIKDAVSRIKARRAELQQQAEPSAGERLYQNIDAFGEVMNMRREFMKADRMAMFEKVIGESDIGYAFEDYDDESPGELLSKILEVLKAGGNKVKYSGFYFYGGNGSGPGMFISEVENLMKKLNLSFSMNSVEKKYFSDDYGMTREKFMRMVIERFPDYVEEYLDSKGLDDVDELDDDDNIVDNFFYDDTLTFTFPTPQFREEAILFFTTIDRMY